MGRLFNSNGALSSGTARAARDLLRSRLRRSGVAASQFSTRSSPGAWGTSWLPDDRRRTAGWSSAAKDWRSGWRRTSINETAHVAWLCTKGCGGRLAWADSQLSAPWHRTTTGACRFWNDKALARSEIRLWRTTGGHRSMIVQVGIMQACGEAARGVRNQTANSKIVNSCTTGLAASNCLRR